MSTRNGSLSQYAEYTLSLEAFEISFLKSLFVRVRYNLNNRLAIVVLSLETPLT